MPDDCKQLISGNEATTVKSECREQLELDRGEVELCAAKERHPRRKVDAKVPNYNGAGWTGSLSPHDGPRVCFQQAKGDRCDEICVCAVLERRNHSRVVGSGHDHAWVTLGPDPPKNADRVEPGCGVVDKNQVRLMSVDRNNPFGSGRSSNDAIPVASERPGDAPPTVRIPRNHDQNCHL
jgi:hypothetical protein